MADEKKTSEEKLSGMDIASTCFLEANICAFTHSVVFIKLADFAASRGYIKKPFASPALTAAAVFSFNLGFMNYMLTNRCQRLVLENSEDKQLRENAKNFLFFQW